MTYMLLVRLPVNGSYVWGSQKLDVDFDCAGGGQSYPPMFFKGHL